MADDQHWVRTLYERYVQLYGDPIEQPINKKEEESQDREPERPAS